MTRLRSIIALTFALTAAATAGGQDKREAEAAEDAAFVEPFVGETTFLVAKIDLKQIGLPDVDKALATAPPEAKAALTEALKAFTSSLDHFRELADGQPIYATVGIPTSQTRISAFAFRRKTSDQNTEAVTKFVKSQKRAVFVKDDYIVATVRGGKPAPHFEASDSTLERLEPAFGAVAGYPVQLLIVPPDYVWRTVRELSPELPSYLGGGPSRVLTDGVQWAAVGLDTQRLRLELVIHSASDEAAKAFADHIPVMLTAMYKKAAPAGSPVPVKLVELLIGSLKPEVDGRQIRLRIDAAEQGGVTLALLARIAGVAGEKQRRNSNVNRFKQILLAMHNYYDTHQGLPPADALRDKDGKHGLSWRVHILPFVEQQALYKQFRLDEPWDSPHNKKLIAKMPDVFARGSLAPGADRLKPGYTTFLAPTGENTIFGGKKATKFPQITDGTSLTVALVEVKPEQGVPWTAPTDYSFDPKDPLEGVLIGTDGRWQCGFADGSVQQLRGDIPPQTALHLFLMNDGHPINPDAIR